MFNARLGTVTPSGEKPHQDLTIFQRAFFCRWPVLALPKSRRLRNCADCHSKLQTFRLYGK
jgi:hypothetical protein